MIRRSATGVAWTGCRALVRSALGFELGVQQAAHAHVKLATQHVHDALQLIAGHRRGEGLADFEQQGDPGLVQPAEHGGAVDAVLLGERITGDVVKVALTQQVALPDVEGCQPSAEGLLEGRAVGVSQYRDLGVVSVAHSFDQRFVAGGLGTSAGPREVDDQSRGHHA